MLKQIKKWLRCWLETKENSTPNLKNQIRFCANPNCSHIVIGKSNKKYCSESCKKKEKYKRKKEQEKNLKTKNQNSQTLL